MDMESSACGGRASDAEQSARSYSVTAECEPAMVKAEPEWVECGVSEAAVAEGLYAGHEVKDELLIGPELIWQQDIAFSMQNMPNRAEEAACKLQPAGEAGPATESTHARAHYTTRKHINTRCDICHKQMHKSSLARHLRTHTGDKPFSCGTCKKRFTAKSILDDHVRTHTVDMPYSCDACHKLFTDKSALTQHVQIHLGEKPYKCTICKKQFAKQSSLTMHMRTYTGKKLYSCDICKKQFTAQSYLTMHLRTHTSEKPYGCDKSQSASDT